MIQSSLSFSIEGMELRASGSLTKALALGLKHLFVKHYYSHFINVSACLTVVGYRLENGDLNEMPS